MTPHNNCSLAVNIFLTASKQAKDRQNTVSLQYFATSVALMLYRQYMHTRASELAALLLLATLASTYRVMIHNKLLLQPNWRRR